MLIHIQSDNNAGSIEHYYHFLYGYLLPFIQNVDDFNHDYVFDNCGGPMNKHILNLPKYKTDIINTDHKPEKRIKYQGYDKIYRDININYIHNKMCDLFGIDKNLSGNQTILIDRLPPDDFYPTQAVIKKSGSSRRNIPNIEDIYQLLKNNNIDVVKASTEIMSLYDQIKLFKTASRIISQHGAALGNMIWCNPGTEIIEIKIAGGGPLDWFNDLSRRCNFKYQSIHQKGSFSSIDPNIVLDMVTKT